MEEQFFTDNERKILVSDYRKLCQALGERLQPGDSEGIKDAVRRVASSGVIVRDRFGFNPVTSAMQTALCVCECLGADRNMCLAVILSSLAQGGMTEDEIGMRWGEDVKKLVVGLDKVASLYSRNASVESENFRKLLLTFAQDIRVIILMIVDRLRLMRAINHHPAEKYVRDTANEASYLYAPLAHRLGLYAIKSELEDMSLKYSNREVYTKIAHELNQTKAKREAYIADFIAPLKKKLQEEGLNFEIKGRTKSIFSIWNKMKKQHNTVEDIYDLFAIRIVIDCPLEREKPECWLAYSVVTDMYRPNPGRLKDWLSIPKSNGYESLHITVYGPEERWVEVQIRTKRMDVIAEKGLAAHWKYKGIKSESNLDAWMNNVRDILEAGQNGPMELMRNFKMDVYSREVFVFTPRGDLYKLPQGATLLDFAFNVHTRIGTQCVGGKVNGKNRKINYKLQSGDTVEVFTNPQQEPSADWLSVVVTTKARNKIRSVLKEAENKSAEIGKELLQRRFKNRKLDFDEAAISRLVSKMGYKTAIAFFSALGAGEIEINDVVDTFCDMAERAAKAEEGGERISASEYMLQQPTEETETADGGGDIIVIGDDIKGINYKLSRCCNPIYGDDVFGFISSEGVIKIHRADCPNAAHIRSRYGSRLIRTRWSGKGGAPGTFTAVLRVVGKDDIGIVTNITSIINKEKSVSLRSISIDSNDGLFHGFISVGVSDTLSLNQLMKKIETVKGVKNVQRNK
ncbi:MAG: bifunctional (p)ppGpp synthetase/guanosine-3',5'-bis(diphosphate) 3'-pyrophosphohydrolase [Muribaculaceae bacterium]|nr:bifunctional (p)ppGpp synthetase/guanosine-3',5'-bis(diphosphate) 3'-pyrophosphohydrolase [Muribaculaceae bacterium]